MTAVSASDAGDAKPGILVINGGSSSVRFAFYTRGAPPCLVLEGKLDRIGSDHPTLTVHAIGDGPTVGTTPMLAHQGSPIAGLVRWIDAQPGFATVEAIGHRVVHGMGRSAPETVTPALLADLARIVPYDPGHLPLEIALIDEFRRRHPHLPQIACFDTAFHHALPRVASILPIPRRYEAGGVRRYGFHGLSYDYLTEELVRLGDRAATEGRVVLLHLGNGASLAAVRNGRSIDTSMAFTPAAGLVMGTRAGDLDPGIISYLARAEHMSTEEFEHMVNHDSGLLGVSETSADMRELLALEGHDTRAAEAVALFCYQTKKWIGAFAAALGGLDTLVFAGGIGENLPLIRQRICSGLDFLGVHLHAARNADNAPLISPDESPVKVRVIPTDEQLMIARAVVRLLERT